MLRLALFAAIIVIAFPASAQGAGERVNQLIIYGDDICPPSGEADITVCARKAESERYRIPEPLRESPSPDNDAWNSRVIAYERVGNFGILSCTPAGAGGHLGCTQKLIENAYAEKLSASDLRFSQLIEDERAKRLATLESEAAEIQKRVEALEAQMMERSRLDLE